MKNIVYGMLFLITAVSAQHKNEFLDRNFWKKNPSIEVVKQKIKEGNNPSELNKHAFDAVTWALIEKVDNETVKFLLKQEGNDVNKSTHDARNYIFWAAYKGNVEMMKYLLKKGSRTDIVDNHGYSLLNFSAVTGQDNPKLYDLLLKNGANPLKERSRKNADALLLLMPHIKDFKMVNYFTEKGLDITAKDSDGSGAINYAASGGNKEMIDLLIEKGLPYKTLNNRGGNAFLLATKGSRKGYNSLDFFKYLESIGIAPNITNKDGETPLHNLAYGNKDVATFNYFLDKNVDVNQVDKDGNTALLNSASRNSLDIISLLAERTKNINHTNKKGESVLIKAMKNTPEVVSYLLQNGAKVEGIDRQGNSIVYYLLHTYNPKKESDFIMKLKLLTEKGITITKPEENGNTLYHIAVDKNSLPLLKYITSYDVSINAKNKKGLTALQEAVMTAKNDKIIKFLLEKGADKNVKTNLDETIFDLAKENEALQQTDISFLK